MRRIREEILAGFAAVSLAMTPVACFHWGSQAYPNGDEAEYMWVGLTIYHRFLSSGFFAGLNALYTFRSWKPILHPILSVPAFFISGGHVMPAQVITMMILYALFCTALYALSRVYLGKIDSVLSTATLACIPWMTARGYFFNSELPFAVSFVGAWAALFILTA